ncbi:hypothetical protein GGF31_002806 [Allomyces arbusculus]|nr:hypothetical protein GGF31_002806 [Allomyces arbusculus]
MMQAADPTPDAVGQSDPVPKTDSTTTADAGPPSPTDTSEGDSLANDSDTRSTHTMTPPGPTLETMVSPLLHSLFSLVHDVNLSQRDLEADLERMVLQSLLDSVTGPVPPTTTISPVSPTTETGRRSPDPPRPLEAYVSAIEAKYRAIAVHMNDTKVILDRVQTKLGKLPRPPLPPRSS